MTDSRKTARISQALSRLYGVVVQARSPGQGAAKQGDGASVDKAPPVSGDRAQARALIQAIDAGGVPLNPARVNQIARSLGLEVSAHAPLDETIARIRAALERG